MSEPKAKADRIDMLTPWLYHWMVLDDRIGDFRSDAYAVQTPDGKVLIDPLPLADKALAELGKVAAICLTGGQHQRSAWRYRKALGAPVYAPEGADELDEEPDEWFRDGDILPGGFEAIWTPGLGNGFALLIMTEGGSGALFCGDLLIRKGDGLFELLPEEYLLDPGKARASAERLSQLPVETLCPAHGLPCLTGCGQAITEALKGDKGK